MVKSYLRALQTDLRIKTLEGRTADAKAKGHSEIVFEPPIEDPAFITGLSDALSKFSVVIVTPVAMQTLTERSHMASRYALNVQKMLTDRPPVTTNSLLVDSPFSGEAEYITTRRGRSDSGRASRRRNRNRRGERYRAACGG